MIPITHRIASAALAFMMLIPFAPTALAQHHDDFYRGAQRHHPYNDDYDRRRVTTQPKSRCFDASDRSDLN